MNNSTFDINKIDLVKDAHFNNGSFLMDERAETILIESCLYGKEFYEMYKNMGVTDKFFCLKNNIKHWQVYTEVYSKKKSLDIFLFQDQLKAYQYQSDYISSTVTLLHNVDNQLNRLALTGTGIAAIVRTLRDKMVRREMLELADKLKIAAYRVDEDAQEIITSASKEFYKLQSTLMPEHVETVFAASELSAEYIYEIENRQEGKAKQEYLKTGILDLDRTIQGAQLGELTVIAGRPAMGKTSVAVNIAHHIAKNNNVSVLFQSLEVSKAQLFKKLLAAAISDQVTHPKINQSRLFANDKLSDEEVDELIEALGYVDYFERFMISDKPQLTITDLMANIERAKEKTNQYPQLIVIDYVGLMDLSLYSGKGSTEAQQIQALLVDLQVLARKYNCAIIILAQLNRENDNKLSDKRPKMSCIRGSGAYEQQAAVIIGLYRDWVYNKEADDRVMELLVLKNRFGEPKDIKTWYEPAEIRFKAMA